MIHTAYQIAVLPVQPEQWRPVRGFEGVYEVSDRGRIHRVLRVPRSKEWPKPLLDAAGYRTANFWHNGKQRTIRVHQVVFEAFNGPVPKGLVINHKDGDKANPSLTNLEAITQQANIDHAVATGLLDQRGERNHQAKLTASFVAMIRAMHVRGKFGHCKLAKMFKVSPGTIRGILAGEDWAHSCVAPPAPVHILRAIAQAAWDKHLKPRRRKTRSPIRSEQYLRWIRTCPCVVCNVDWRIEAHHTGPHGLSVKSSDFSAIPLCPAHHRTGPDAYHKLGPEEFARRHDLDMTAIISMFQQFYRERTKDTEQLAAEQTQG